MKKPQGLFLPSGEFVAFAETSNIDKQIATRSTSAYGLMSLGTWLPNPDPVLKKLGKDINTYRDLRADAHVGGAIRRRKSAVQALERGINRKLSTNRITKSIESILNDLPMDRISTELHDAVLYGYAPAEIVWGRVGNMTVPVDVVGKPPEWFAYNNDNQLLFRSRNNPMGDLLKPNKFIVARQEPTYENPYGFADLSMCFWPATFKKAGFGFWMKFTEKYGMPWPIGKYPRGTTQEDIQSLLDQLEQMVQDAIAAVPNDATVEFLKNDASTNADAYSQFLMFCRAEITTALLGQNQSTETNSTNASAQAGLEVTRDIRDGDAKMLAACLSELIALIVDENWAGTQQPILYDFWEQEEIDTTRATRDEILTKAGAKFTKIYFQRTFGFADDEIEVAQAEVIPTEPAPTMQKFAGVDVEAFPDQAALDAALESLYKGVEINQQSEAMLKPVFAALEGLETEADIQRALVAVYPKMSVQGLEKTLTKLYFAAETLGRLSALEELNA